MPTTPVPSGVPASEPQNGAVPKVNTPPAPPVSYVFNLEAAGDADIGPEEIQSIFAAIAPIVGTARIASAASNITRALGIVLDIAEFEAEEEANA